MKILADNEGFVGYILLSDDNGYIYKVLTKTSEIFEDDDIDKFFEVLPSLQESGYWMYDTDDYNIDEEATITKFLESNYSMKFEECEVI